MNTKTILTIGVIGVVGFYLYSRMRKGQSLNPFKSFAADEDTFRSNMSFTGNEDSSFYNASAAPLPIKTRIKKIGSLYTAGGYDSNHQNSDGTRGATWIGYNQDNTQGYWVKGFVKQGTQM